MPVVQPGKASHTTLEVQDLQYAVRFYREVLGLRTHGATATTGHMLATNGHYAAMHERHNPGPQPFLNFYTRPVADAAAVDVVHAQISAVKDQWQIAEITAPAREDPTKFGVGTYGFYLLGVDGNWWRIEENDGPFGPVEIPADAEPRDSLVPAGPISYVTLECRDLQRSMQFYREFLGIDAEQRAPHYFFTRGNGGVRAIVVERGDALVEQTLQNHHGITVWMDAAKIDALRAAAQARQDEFGIQRIKKAINQHGSYSFYMQDQDTNWWEIEVWDGHVDPWTRAERRIAAALVAS